MHKEFLARPGSDPRKSLTEQLLNDIGPEGDILVYNSSFENARLNEIARDFLQYARKIACLIPRITDLMEPFRMKHYYTPEMKGSNSIKQVLPALAPGFSYSGLAIDNGGDASLAFEKLQTETDQAAAARIRHDLMEYCKLDTLAMVEIVRALEGV